MASAPSLDKISVEKSVDYQLRQYALSEACRSDAGGMAKNVVERADVYYKFLKGE